jgi:hypothetical protein
VAPVIENELQDKQLIPFSFEMPPFDPQLAKLPSAFVGIPESFLVLIGHVIGAWSRFDMAFNRFLGGLQVANGAIPEGWHLESFKKRSTKFKQLCAARFGSHSSILQCVGQLISDAKLLQTDRNVIAHGHILIKIQTHGAVDNQIQGTLSLHCVGVEARKTIERDYSLPDLERIRYDFAYVCGRMDALCNGEHLHRLQLSSLDTHALQEFLKCHPYPSTQPTV